MLMLEPRVKYQPLFPVGRWRNRSVVTKYYLRTKPKSVVTVVLQENLAWL